MNTPVRKTNNNYLSTYLPTTLRTEFSSMQRLLPTSTLVSGFFKSITVYYLGKLYTVKTGWEKKGRVNWDGCVHELEESGQWD